MAYKNLTAPCGIPCFECLAYNAQANEAIKMRISEAFGLALENSECSGCRNRNGIGFLSEKNNVFPEGKCILMNAEGECKIFLCTKSKQLHNFSECEDLPCDHLQPLADRANRIPHNLKLYNLCLINKLGLEKWANEKAGRTWKDYMTVNFDPE